MHFLLFIQFPEFRSHATVFRSLCCGILVTRVGPFAVCVSTHVSLRISLWLWQPERWTGWWQPVNWNYINVRVALLYTVRGKCLFPILWLGPKERQKYRFQALLKTYILLDSDQWTTYQVVKRRLLHWLYFSQYEGLISLFESFPFLLNKVAAREYQNFNLCRCEVHASCLQLGSQSDQNVGLSSFIYSCQPAPFFVLDEIDAALDNTNINNVIFNLKIFFACPL